MQAGETCDDGNASAGDGCNASCQVEAGWVCGDAPSVCCFQDVASAYAVVSGSRTQARGIIELTADASLRNGVAWYRERLDFTRPFRIAVRLNLGDKDGAPNASTQDSGADGGSLLFQRMGLDAKGAYVTEQDGSELGAKGITPVVGVEFDTYNNGTDFGDVTQGDEDHTAVFQGGARLYTNGSPGPGKLLSPAVCMNNGSTCTNFEDGQWHRFEVSWSGLADHHLRVIVDGVQRIDLNHDLISNYFANDPTNIIFGFAASTGGLSNRHRFCPLAPDGFGVPRDLDGDGTDDALDADDDGDGASDATETGGIFAPADPSADHDADGVPNYRDVKFWRSVLSRASDCPDTVAPIGACDSYPAAMDFDGDGIADHVDLDSDGDGTPDATDAAPRDACVPTRGAGCAPLPSDGGVDAGQAAGEDADASVLDAAIPSDASAPSTPDASAPVPEQPSPGDLDGDGVPNESDVAPTDPCRPNANALQCASGDADGDGLSNAFECPGLRMCRDTDGDGVADYADADSDGDGIPDKLECPDMNACPDSDGDGTPDLLQRAPKKSEDGCALGDRGSPLSALWLALLLLSARTSSSARSARAPSCGARRSLPWSRAVRRPRPGAPPRS